MKDNVIVEKSMSFAVRIVKLYQYLCNEKKEYELGKQILRSGTSIGANVREGVQAQSKNDFVAKMNISLKEAAETEYWIELMHKSEILSNEQYESIIKDANEIARILTSIVKSSKQ